MLLGICGAAAMAPVFALVLYAVAITGLVWLIDSSRSGRAAFGIGWCWGFGYFLAGLYWIANALLVDPERFLWLVPFTAAGLPAVFGVFPALAALVQYWLAPRGPRRIFAFALIWGLVEWLRGHVLTGFPWNLAGHVWAFSDAMLQGVALVGIYGLGLFTVALAASPAALAGAPASAGRSVGAAAIWPVALFLPLVLLLWLGGALRLAFGESEFVAGVTLRLIQPNVSQNLKWQPEERARIFRRLLELTAAPGHDRISHVIWPESAVPFNLTAEPEALAAMAQVTPQGGAILTGAPRAAGAGASFRAWNSLLAVDDRGRVVAAFDKFHLVPFGEYVPWRGMLPIEKIVPGGVDFSPGSGPRTLDVVGLPPFSPLICFEVIFPGAVTDPDNRPQWLLNITNDAWYGNSSGPYQHLEIARIRAIEEGLPLLRVANTGISTVIDGYGRVLARLALNQSGVLDTALPRALPGSTVYGRWGDWVLAPGFLILTLVSWLRKDRP
ncbi:MAG: apolipoprotein N-acyltransferase [Alphaproteobacteria bacterium]|nr:apolipoprotein N-acyltransferase [Alphaproteobacteria bacterium]